MIKEAYVSFEVAKLLKEKGFNEPIQYFYKFDSKELYRGTVFTNIQIGDKFYNAPTHQMAMAWLREIHKVNIDIETCYTYINKNENYEVTGYEFTIHSVYDPCYEDNKTYDSFEEAVEAALKYSLENLI